MEDPVADGFGGGCSTHFGDNVEGGAARGARTAGLVRRWLHTRERPSPGLSACLTAAADVTTPRTCD